MRESTGFGADCGGCSFVDPNSALAFFSSVFQNGITIHARRLRLGWGRNQPLSPGVQMVVQAGGSRNVYIGGLDDSFECVCA